MYVGVYVGVCVGLPMYMYTVYMARPTRKVTLTTECALENRCSIK